MTRLNTPTTALHNRLLYEHGRDVLITPGSKCSCSPTGDPDHPNPNCAACFGAGDVYDYSQTWIERGAVTSLRQNRDWAYAGVMVTGNVALSLRPSVDLLPDGTLVQIEFKEGLPFEGQLVRRQTGGLQDGLFYTATHIDRILTTNPSTGAITYYAPTTDYLLSADQRHIVWQSGGNAPAVGTWYSIVYHAFYDWLIFTPGDARWQRHQQMGARYLMVKRHDFINAKNSATTDSHINPNIVSDPALLRAYRNS